MRGWKYPTDDSRRIRVRDLLNHIAGFVTDDPWGDRQTSLPEEEFTQLLRSGVSLTRAPGSAYEYSNLGFALLGRIITNVSRQPYAETIGRTLLPPLGVESSGFIADAAPRERRALGYRWEDDTWRLEPTLAPGVFGAMGGLQTSANDYAKGVAFLLSAWPPRDGPDSGPVRRATVRELAEGSDFLRLRTRPSRGGADVGSSPINLHRLPMWPKEGSRQVLAHRTRHGRHPARRLTRGKPASRKPPRQSRFGAPPAGARGGRDRRSFPMLQQSHQPRDIHGDPVGPLDAPCRRVRTDAGGAGRPRGPRCHHGGERRQHQGRQARRGAPPRSASRLMPPTCRRAGALRARGHNHARALRSVADRLLYVLCTLLERQVLFDPSYTEAPATAAA